MSKKIIKIDASALKNSSCMLSFYRTVILGYREEVNSVSIEFGTAVHLFVKVMYETNGNFNEAIKAATGYFTTTKMIVPKMKQYLSVTHLTLTCIKFWEWLSKEKSDFGVVMGSDGKPAVEITFSNKIYEDEWVIVYLEGTIDKVGKFIKGCWAFGDNKTTASRDQEDYMKGYELSTQLMFYYLNLFLYASRNPDSMIAEMCKGKVGCFIDGVFLNGKDSIEFGRSRIFFFEQWQIDRYRVMLMEKIMKLVHYVTTNTSPLPEGILTDTCSKPENGTTAWRCRYWNICAAPDEIAAQHLVRKLFIVKPYEPLLFGKADKPITIGIPEIKL